MVVKRDVIAVKAGITAIGEKTTALDNSIKAFSNSLPQALNAVVNPIKIPELLQEIAAFVDNPRNLSSFAQMDRFTHAAAAALTSCIFRDAIVRLESIGSLAESFSNAQRAASYGSLPLRGRVSGTVSIVQKLHTDLIAVFLVFSTHGRLV
ncbi:hypothetical protein B0H14DRAFT_3443516 [Mycena olivaceomarginata]|nr:hypothetical protein B0H14DRAFT_3443516 [Mycena olivaceomarginata]